MTIAVKKAAESYEAVTKELNISVSKVKEDSKKLLKNTYVDDGTTRGSRRQVKRMIGRILEDGSYSGTISAMIKQVRLKLKTIVSSVSQDQEALS